MLAAATYYATSSSGAGMTLLVWLGLWLLIFGGIGAWITNRKGRGKAIGFLLGTFLGWIGWIIAALIGPGTYTIKDVIYAAGSDTYRMGDEQSARQAGWNISSRRIDPSGSTTVTYRRVGN